MSAEDFPAHRSAGSHSSESRSSPFAAPASQAPASHSPTWVPDKVAIETVRRLCAGLDRRDPHLAQLFYRHLFALAPQTRQMFPPDMTMQTERLFAALLDAVNAMDRPESIRSKLHALGASHARRHMVTEDMYVYVGHAMIRAVRDVTGDWSSETASAWASVYLWLSDEMIAGAREARHDRR